MILHILQMDDGETREEVPMNVMIQQPAAGETERMQANREELVERVARAMRKDGTCSGYLGYPFENSVTVALSFPFYCYPHTKQVMRRVPR